MPSSGAKIVFLANAACKKRVNKKWSWSLSNFIGTGCQSSELGGFVTVQDECPAHTDSVCGEITPAGSCCEGWWKGRFNISLCLADYGADGASDYREKAACKSYCSLQHEHVRKLETLLFPPLLKYRPHTMGSSCRTYSFQPSQCMWQLCPAPFPCPAASVGSRREQYPGCGLGSSG